jgi:hypothetical protein
MIFLTADMLVKVRSLVSILKDVLELSSYLSLIANITQKWYDQEWVKAGWKITHNRSYQKWVKGRWGWSSI